MLPQGRELQKKVAQHLLLKIDSNEISLDRASEIAKMILHLFPENLTEEKFEEAYLKVKTIPELTDVFANSI